MSDYRLQKIENELQSIRQLLERIASEVAPVKQRPPRKDGHPGVSFISPYDD